MKPLEIGDLYCGAGGSSSGIVRAARELGIQFELTGVNHWAVAIASHSANHPYARHFKMEIEDAPADVLFPRKRLDVMWASPECTEHSYAGGGKSINDQRRANAWSVPRLADATRPSIIIVENVTPFTKWGPVEPARHSNGKLKRDKDGDVIYRPIASRKGETFREWFAAVEACGPGYRGEWRLLNAADYGEAQSRIRFFAVFTAPGIRYEWPEATHARRGDPSLTGTREPWRGARENIDFSIPSQSIFSRKTPLSPNTLARIEVGLKLFCTGALREAFLIILRNHADAASLDDPSPTLTAGGLHLGVAETRLRPFVGGNRTHNVPVSLDEPAPTVTTASGGGLFIAEPFVLGQHGGSVARDVEQPVPTITTDGAISLVEPFVIDVRHGERPRVASANQPMHTLTARNGAGVVEPFVVEAGRTDDRVHSTADPLGTVTGSNRFAAVEPFIVPQMGDGARSIDQPAPTVLTTSRGIRLITPLVGPADPDAPSGQLVEIDGELYLLDLFFRMLQPVELKQFQGLPADYILTGTKEAQTAQIGNAVSEKVAYRLGRAAFEALGYGVAEDAA